MDYIIVQEAPTELKSNEMVIKQPNFLEEVVENKGRRGVQKYATVNSLRTVLMSITDKYDNTINPYRLTLHKYEGQKFEDDMEKLQTLSIQDFIQDEEKLELFLNLKSQFDQGKKLMNLYLKFNKIDPKFQSKFKFLVFYWEPPGKLKFP